MLPEPAEAGRIVASGRGIGLGGQRFLVARICRAFSAERQDIAGIAWSFAERRCEHCPLIAAIAAAARARIAEFDVQGLSTTVWAFATLAFTDQPLLNAIAA